MARVGVVGATGAVGIEMIKTLEKRQFPLGKLTLLASARSVGKKLKFGGQEIAVQELTKDSFTGIDIALFSAGGGISKEFAPLAAQAGCVVVDNSSAFRMDDAVPLVIPEINSADVKKQRGIIANPNCTTLAMIVAIWPFSASCCVEVGPTPGVLQIRVRRRLPRSRSARSRLPGHPWITPKPPTISVAPSPMSATASAALLTILPARAIRRPHTGFGGRRGSLAHPAPDRRPARLLR